MSEDQLEMILIALEKAGCQKSASEKAVRFLKAGMREELIHQLRLCRCERLEDLHRIQKQIDCLDQIIRQMKQN